MLKRKLHRAGFLTFGLLILAAGNIAQPVDSSNSRITGDSTTILPVSVLTIPPVKLNKQADKFVKKFVKQYNYTLTIVRQRGETYFPLLDSILELNEVPVELKYLAVIESELNPKATSRVGAVGPWQFMPGTAKVLGLKISRKYDERTNFKKSTKAAAIYLRDLYSTYGDWLLVLAAYNCGPAPVNSAIRKSGSRNFWKLQYFLPAESRKHVKKFIATHYYFEGTGSVVTHTKAEYAKYLKQVEEFSKLQDANKAKEIIVADIDTTTISKKVVLN